MPKDKQATLSVQLSQLAFSTTKIHLAPLLNPRYKRLPVSHQTNTKRNKSRKTRRKMKSDATKNLNVKSAVTQATRLNLRAAKKVRNQVALKPLQKQAKTGEDAEIKAKSNGKTRKSRKSNRSRRLKRWSSQKKKDGNQRNLLRKTV